MIKTIHSYEHGLLGALLAEARDKAGLIQEGLSGPRLSRRALASPAHRSPATAPPAHC